MKSFLILLFIFSTKILAAPTQLIKLRSEIRQLILTRSCANCHTPNLSTTKLGALKIYDLSKVTWSATMNDRQIIDLRRRLKEKLSDEEILAMNRNPHDKPLTSSQDFLLDEFVQKELQYRANYPKERFQELTNSSFLNLKKILNN